jgi:hypothetical protein
LLLRRLDRERKWESLASRRVCVCCRANFSGREIEVVGGTRERGPLRLVCPTDTCRSTPSDWVALSVKPAARAMERNGVEVAKVLRHRPRIPVTPRWINRLAQLFLLARAKTA